MGMIQTKNNAQLCFGIDPNPTSISFESFKQCVKIHTDFLKFHRTNHLNKNDQSMLKLQLAFFLAQGSRGIALLESFVDEFRRDYTIILDGKFNEIENSLKAYLKFVFSTLQVHGVTINPFLGEKTLELTFETCAREVGSKGRVYVLCVTSENSQSTLSYMQKNHVHIMNACSQIRDQLFDKDPSLKKIAGVVIGANQRDVLLSEKIRQSSLSILSPGLGAQNADWNIIQKCSALKNEITFPISRGIFEGGNISLEEVTEKYLSIKKYF